MDSKPVSQSKVWQIPERLSGRVFLPVVCVLNALLRPDIRTLGCGACNVNFQASNETPAGQSLHVLSVQSADVILRHLVTVNSWAASIRLPHSKTAFAEPVVAGSKNRRLLASLAVTFYGCPLLSSSRFQTPITGGETTGPLLREMEGQNGRLSNTEYTVSLRVVDSKKEAAKQKLVAANGQFYVVEVS